MSNAPLKSFAELPIPTAPTFVPLSDVDREAMLACLTKLRSQIRKGSLFVSDAALGEKCFTLYAAQCVANACLAVVIKDHP